MKKFLILAITLCCIASLFAQNESDPKVEKYQKFLAVNQAILNGDAAQQQLFDNYVGTYGFTSDALILQASQLEKAERFDEAKEKLKQAVAIVTDNELVSKSTIYRFLIKYADGMDEKLNYANASIQADPKNIYAYMERARIYKINERYKEAVKDTKKAVKLSKNDPDIRTELARVYLIMGDEAKGLKELNNILKDYPSAAEARKLRSLNHFYSGNLEPFVDDYLYYLQIEHELDMELINAVADTGYQYILDYAELIKKNIVDPEDMAYWEFFEANLKMMTGNDIEGALKQLDYALTIKTENDDLRGRLLALQLKYYDATEEDDTKEIEIINQIEEIIAKNEYAPATWILAAKARLNIRQKEYDKAISCYSQIIKQNDDSMTIAFYYYLKTNIYQDKMDDAANALNNIDSAVAYAPDYVPFIYKHARICEKYHQPSDYQNVVREDCEKILAIDTVPYEDSYRHFALAMLGRKAEAEEWFKRINEIPDIQEETKGSIIYNGACMYALLNDVYNATRLLMDAIERDHVSCSQIQEDADFDNIRETAEFKSIQKITCADEESH